MKTTNMNNRNDIALRLLNIDTNNFSLPFFLLMHLVVTRKNIKKVSVMQLSAQVIKLRILLPLIVVQLFFTVPIVLVGDMWDTHSGVMHDM